MATIKIKYKNKEFEREKGTLITDILDEVKQDYKYDILVASVNNKLTGLDGKLNKDCTIDFFDVTNPTGNVVYERGILFLFSTAVKDVLNCDVRMLHTIDEGICAEILTNNLISEVTVEKIKIRMRELCDSAIAITKIMVSRIEAIDYYEKINQMDKANSLRYISNSSISLYKLDDTLDFFYGVLPNNTKLLSKYNVKYLKDNKVILMIPNANNISNFENIKFVKNEKLLSAIDKNDAYLNSLQINTSVELNRMISTGNYGDLIMISESLLSNELFEIANKISKDKELKVVLITGPSSSGKTTTCKKLALFLRSKGLKPIPISVDDFYTNIKDRVLDENGEPEKEKIEAIDTSQFNKKISELLNGKEVYLPKYNFITGKQELSDKTTKMSENSVLLIEGIHAFNEQLTEIIPDKNKFKLYICPLTPLNIDNHNIFKSTDNRLLRRMIRDNRSRGASASVTLRNWKNVRKAEEEIIMPYIKEADFILNTSLVYELGVLKTYAEPLLFSVSEDDPCYDEAIRLINLFRVILGMPSDNVPNDSILREFIGGSCFKEW